MLAEVPSKGRAKGKEVRTETRSLGESVSLRRRDMSRVSPEGQYRVRVPNPLVFCPEQMCIEFLTGTD